MALPELDLSEAAPDEISCDALVIGAFTGEAPVLSAAGNDLDRALDGYISEHLTNTGYKASAGETTLVPTFRKLPAKNIVVVGLGPESDLRPPLLRRAAAAAARRLAKHQRIAFALHDQGSAEEAVAVEAVAEGLLLATYSFTQYKSQASPYLIDTALILATPAAKDALHRGRVLAKATMLARDLTNEPAFALTPDLLAGRARDIAAEAGLECTVLDESALRKRGFGGLLGVGAGSDQPPRFITLRYASENARGKVVLIGKGITFDSGGLSLKDQKNMEQMKTDKAGAAAVLGAMSAIGQLQPAVEVLAFVPAAENMPGGGALKPGDVLTHYGGKTSEVLNTDAEGRLVLADALAFACEQAPDAVVDIATLTGSVVIALGQKASGLFSNDDHLAEELLRASEAAGERMWRMPLFEDYRSDLESEVADLKNIGSRYGGSIFGALFLKDFVRDGIPWGHIDIAGTARSDKDHDEITKGGTGVGVRTLVRWVEARGAA